MGGNRSLGEISPNNNVDWVSRKGRKHLRNPTENFEQIWIIHLREPIAAMFCMSPSLEGNMPESVISQENKSPFTLYIEFHNVKFFSWISIVQLIKFNHICMHNDLSPNIPKFKSRGKIMKSENFVTFL